jgi:transposase
MLYEIDMHIQIVPNRGSPPAVLLRESYREGGKVKKRTLANLSSLPADQIEAIRAVLRGDKLAPVAEAFTIVEAQPHGHVQAVMAAMKQLGMAELIASQPDARRDRVLAMLAARILSPHTKLATTRWWQQSTLAQEFGVTKADEDDLYEAMDWLLARQDRIQKKLTARHLKAGGLVLYDLSSSYFEGKHCPLAKRGYSRDRKSGTLQVNYGVLTDARGCPVAVSVHDGNTADPVTLIPEIERVKNAFAIDELVIVGDRGMISQKAIEAITLMTGVDWITALKTGAIRGLAADGALQLDLFDERNLFELVHRDYPGERLVACRNPQLARLRAHKREDMLRATEAALAPIKASVTAGRLTGADRIGVAVGKVVNRYKMAKHIALDIADAAFTFTRKHEQIEREAALDGIYVVRTSLDTERMDAAECVRSYKALSQVERVFKTMKSIDLKVRPIHHRLADRVRAHIFLCVLAYYVEWHMREAWREMMFADEDQAAKADRDPVAPATRSAGALAKINRRQLDDGSPVHSFATLLSELATLTRNRCLANGTRSDTAPFTILATPNPTQTRALNLMDTIQL